VRVHSRDADRDGRRAFRRRTFGNLIKNVADIELAAKINAFVFDKTGTLTTGQLAVSRLAPIGDAKPAELLLLAASAENTASPDAKALAQLADEAGVPLAEPKDFVETAGRGVKANINGQPFSWVARNGSRTTACRKIS